MVPERLGSFTACLALAGIFLQAIAEKLEQPISIQSIKIIPIIPNICMPFKALAACWKNTEWLFSLIKLTEKKWCIWIQYLFWPAGCRYLQQSTYKTRVTEFEDLDEHSHCTITLLTRSSCHLITGHSCHYFQSNKITVVALFIWAASYLRSSLESVQFPQSPGSGPDILATGSCRSLWIIKNKKKKKRKRNKKRAKYTSPYYYSFHLSADLSGEIILQIRICACFRPSDLWLSSGASPTLVSPHGECFGVAAALLISCLMRASQHKCHTGTAA